MNRAKYFISGIVLVTAVLMGTVLKARAQDSTKTLRLDDAITAALNNNKTVQLAKLNESISVENYKQTEAVFLPEAGFTYTAMGTNNPLNAFGFKLRQQSITPADFNPALLNHPAGAGDFTAKFEVEQPLLNMDMLYMRRGAEMQTEVYRYKTQRTKEYLIFEVKKTYLQLHLAYEAEKLLQDALNTAQTIYTFTGNHFKQGLIQKSDVLNAQVHLAAVESSLAKAKSGIRNASDYLSLLMGQKAGIIYSVNDDFRIAAPATDTPLTIAGTRADFMAMQKAIEASDLMIKSGKMSYLPKLNAFGNFQYNDNRPLGFGAGSYFAGIQLSIDIFKGNRTKNLIATRKLERDKLTEELSQQKDESQLELNKAYRDLSDAQFETSRQKIAVK